MALTAEACEPCTTGTGKLDAKEALALLEDLDGWQLGHLETVIEKNWNFKDFRQAQAFVNKIADIAEAEGHHPDLTFGWGYVMAAITTHKAGGLTRNDFILAAKIDALK